MAFIPPAGHSSMAEKALFFFYFLVMVNQTSSTKASTPSLRVAWLFPSLERGNYWHPIFSQFTQKYPETVIFTGAWPGFAAGYEEAFWVETVGKTRILNTTKTNTGYNRSYIFPSLEIVPKLLKLRPDVIFTSAFSLWTIICLGLKFFFRWRVIILFDGVSPGTDFLNSGNRIIVRRLMAGFIDAFVTNSHAGCRYLTEVVRAKPGQIYTDTYLVTDITALSQGIKCPEDTLLDCQKPIFLFVGQIVPRKGIHYLLEACRHLKAQGYEGYTVVIVGAGAQQSELDAYVQAEGLQHCVRWAGAVDYHRLGQYFTQADVFVLPTLGDVWGVVVSEAMAFGKPILCSQWAGAKEIVEDGQNGYVFDPFDPEALAELMKKLIDSPELIERLGQRSQEIAATLTPEKATSAFFNVVAEVLLN